MGPMFAQVVLWKQVCVCLDPLPRASAASPLGLRDTVLCMPKVLGNQSALSPTQVSSQADSEDPGLRQVLTLSYT